MRARINGMGEAQAFQAFRWVHYKGTDIDECQKMELRAAVMNPTPALAIEDVEKSVVKWKIDVNRLGGVDSKYVDPKDLVQPYWSIMPEAVQDYLINRGLVPEDWSDIDKIELAVEAFMRRWRQKTTERAKGRISAIKSLDEKGNDVETKQALNSVEWQWCDYYEEYIGVKPLNIAVKRRRTEDGAEDEDGGKQEDDKEKEGPKGGSKGGGKKGGGRKKGPEKGCWGCGGDHYQNDCPNLHFSRPQWRGLRPPLYPNQAWNKLYDPIQQSWKGKGKSKVRVMKKGGKEKEAKAKAMA